MKKESGITMAVRRVVGECLRRLNPQCNRRQLTSFSRHFFSTESGGDVVDTPRVKIFDRELKRKHRDRAAWLMSGSDQLLDSVADNLLDRLQDCKRNFPTALSLGGAGEAVRRLLRGRGGIEKLIMMDMSYDMVKRLKKLEENLSEENCETLYLVGDEEFLPIREK